MKTAAIVAGALVAASQMSGAFAQKVRGEQKPIQSPVFGGITVQGCWDDKANMTLSKVDPALTSSGSCKDWCKEEGYTLLALQGQSCFCGLAMPPEDHLVDDKKCKFECPGWPFEACGDVGTPKYYSLWNMGIDVDPPTYEPDEDEDEDKDDDEDENEEKSTSTSAAPSSTTTSATQEEETSAPATTSSDSSEDGTEEEQTDGPPVGAIVGGVVGGIAAVAGVCFGLWFYMRRKRNNEIEEEHRRNAAVNAFISGSKPPSSSGSISMTDSRLDPVMAHRRLSDGSIADNEDYSRKILRVTNA